MRLRVPSRIPRLAMAALACAVPAIAHAQFGGLPDDGPSADGPSAGRGGESKAPRARTRRIDVSPYLEVNQTALVPLKGGADEVLTYTTVAAGINASLVSRNVAVNADLRYEHQFSWNNGLPDQDIISGIANARVDLIRDALSLEGGVLATRLRADGFTGANNSLAGASLTSNVYSAYIGPNLATRVGDLSVTGAYRLGYSRVDTDNPAGAFPGSPAGSFDESWLHNAALSVGMQPGVWLPVGWAVGGGYISERASQLDQRFSDKFARLDLTLPVSPTVALVGGVGYEAIRISNRDALRDADGVPVRDSNGRFVTDPAAPRRLAYDNDGIIWDAGVLWRPSRRTSLEARVGYRYGSESYTGSFSWQPGRHTAVSVTLFDSIDSFGRALNGSLANLPGDFIISRNPFSGDIGGCAFGESEGGACFADTLSGVTAANFRNRGIYGQFVHSRGTWTFNAAAGYARRKFITDGSSVLALANGVSDQSWFGSLGMAHKIDQDSAIDSSVYLNYFNSGFVGGANVFNIGAYGSYHRNFGRRLSATASVGIDSVKRDGLEAVFALLAQIGARYQF